MIRPDRNTKTIGITTTIPSEVLLAAGYQPVDLNNVFIADSNPERLINIAERDGFPLNCCSWIKGIYGVCKERRLDTVLCVTTGDCSNTIMLMEVLKHKGFNTIDFAYPPQPDMKRMQEALQSLADTLGTTLEAASRVRDELRACRSLLMKLDELTWKEGVVSGFENHLWLVNSSDLNGDRHEYQRGLQTLLAECRKRPPYPKDWLRLAYIGVPPVYAQDLHKFLEGNSARVVFNEIQRQFAMPDPGNSLAEQYTRYTYPYSIHHRLRDITGEMEKRHVDGVIHYVQAFCHRGIGDIVFRGSIDLPILTLEGNDEFFLSQHVKTRIEAFIDMLQRNGKHSRKALSI
ncbi:MAG: 2-hydroxyacyl-CoA dehydratase [Chloroflexi bacterium]|nr:2-hydroxyacyl-CoA dehydratase [Chloroflexota bacterium]